MKKLMTEIAQPSRALLATCGAALLATAACGTETNVADASPDAFHTVAELEVDTEKADESYLFTFLAQNDGPVLTVIDAPLGAAQPAIADECALHTFLRVAADDALVPPELLSDCGLSPERDVTSAALRAQDPTLPAALTYLPSARSGPSVEAVVDRCSSAALHDRAAELEQLAAYRPLIKECHELCEDWNDPEVGPPKKPCDHEVCVHVPNPACNHESFVLVDKDYPNGWTRRYHDITRVHAEVRSCGDEPVVIHWRARHTSSADWSAPQRLTAAPGRMKSVTLSAGFDTNSNRWRGSSFEIRAKSDNLSVVSAWVRLAGKNRQTCPLAL